VLQKKPVADSGEGFRRKSYRDQARCWLRPTIDRIGTAFAAVHGVRFWRKADFSRLRINVRFWGNPDIVSVAEPYLQKLTCKFATVVRPGESIQRESRR